VEFLPGLLPEKPIEKIIAERELKFLWLNFYHLFRIHADNRRLDMRGHCRKAFPSCSAGATTDSLMRPGAGACPEDDLVAAIVENRATATNMAIPAEMPMARVLLGMFIVISS
jgi:hypothetical protein